MSDAFFDHPILNSPYAYPARHWELEPETHQPTGNIVEQRRKAEFISPIPKPKKATPAQAETIPASAPVAKPPAAPDPETPHTRSTDQREIWQIPQGRVYRFFDWLEIGEAAVFGVALIIGFGAAFGWLGVVGMWPYIAACVLFVAFGLRRMLRR